MRREPKLKDFEFEVFERCMPIEVMASRGINTMRYGPLRPVGIRDPRREGRPYAVVQLRKEKREGNAYNIVGFQTNLKFSEQKRVFSLIPALNHAEFERYGVMHRNTFLQSPEILNADFSVKDQPMLFLRGRSRAWKGMWRARQAGL